MGPFLVAVRSSNSLRFGLAFSQLLEWGKPRI